MFRRILFATDFTTKSADAQAAVLALARAFGASVEVLHAIEPIPGDGEHDFDDFYAELRARAKLQLREIARAFAAERVTCKTVVVLERRWQAIVDRADPRRVDLVVLGSSSAMEERAGGTTSHQVFLASRVPVLILRGKRLARVPGRTPRKQPRPRKSPRRRA
ncbi:MAG: universal stress protein [Deltaproteobacteria bacterium]|nr:universal stress protein [Deltaproteobacteria bacterium]